MKPLSLVLYPKRRGRLLVVPAFVIAVGVAADAAIALADDAGVPGQVQKSAPVSAELILLHGTNAGTGIDPRLRSIAALRHAPFSAYDSYELLQANALTLVPGRAATAPLPNVSELVVSYLGVLAPTRPTDPKKYMVSVSIQGQSSPILPLLRVNANAGEMLFAAVPGFKGGVLVIGLKIVP